MGNSVKLFVVSAALILALGLAQARSNQQIDAGKRVICYFGSWAVYRHGNGFFDVESIDPFICTHLMFGFAGLSPEGTIMPLDSYNEEEGNWRKGAYRRFTDLKKQNPGLKTLLAIGGWNEGSEKYSKMAATAQGRRRFIESVIPLLEQYDFDGLDLDWEYPSACTVDCGQPEDKVNFVHLCRELRAEFDQRGWLLTAAVSAGEYTIADAYDVPAVSSALHFINVMTYDFHGVWEKYTGHHSPLAPHPMEVGNNTKLNMEYAINYWISQGAPASKLNLGFGTYGRGFILDDPNQNGFYAPAREGIPGGPYTNTVGFWGYNELCERFSRESWTVVRDIYYKSPIAFRNNLWIGYDDAESIREKSIWAMQKGLGGVFTWSLETEDYHGICGGERNPIVKTMWRTVNGDIPEPTTTTVDPDLPTTTTTEPPSTPSTTPPPSDGQCTENGQRIGERCDKFFHVCSWNTNAGRWDHHRFPCAQGLSYDPSITNCDWDANIGC